MFGFREGKISSSRIHGISKLVFLHGGLHEAVMSVRIANSNSKRLSPVFQDLIISRFVGKSGAHGTKDLSACSCGSHRSKHLTGRRERSIA